MKIIHLIFFLTLSGFANELIAQRPGADKEKTISLPISVFQNKKGNPNAIVFRSGVSLNDTDAERIIVHAYNRKFADSIKLNSHRAVIIIQHQFNPKKINDVASDQEKAKLCAEYCALQDDTSAIAICYKNLDCIKKCEVPGKDKLDFIRYLEARRDSDIVKMNAIEAAYKLTGGGIIEMEPIVSYIYHFDNYHNHSDYLLGVDDIYIILIGGKNDLAASSVSTKRTANRNESDFAAAGKLVTSFFPGNPELLTEFPPATAFSITKITPNRNTTESCKQMIDSLSHIIDSLIKLLHPHTDCELESNYKTPTISATVLHLTRSNLFLPGDIIITPLGKIAITLSLHARQWTGVQAGMLGSDLALRTYSLVNDTLTVKIPFEKTKWDALPFIFIQFYPGRDIDRLNPIRLRRFHLKRYDDIKWYLKTGNFIRNRTSIYGCIRLSKQPIQTFAFGFSFALGPNVNIHGGWMWNRTLKAVDPYYLGPLQDEKRLEEFAQTSYLQTVSFGISVSPGIYKDWFGK